MRIINMTPSQQIKHYTDMLVRREEMEKQEVDLEKALKRERELSAAKKAARLFSLPFKKRAFKAINDASQVLALTFVFAVLAAFVQFGSVFCAIVDFVYIILFGLFYPFALFYFAAFKSLRIKKFEEKIEKIEKSLSNMTSRKVLEEKIAKIKNDMPETTSSYTSKSSVEDTEWYKEKSDEYYRMYMGYPPKEESSLSSLSTDTTLDLHPGDY